MASGRKSSIFEVKPLRELQKEFVHRVIHFDESGSSNDQNNLPPWVQEITANQKGKNAEEKLKLNTYELNPKNIIPRCLVYELMKGIIKEAASNTEGESFTLKDKCELIKTACEEVKQQVKTLLLGEKYKVVSTCSFIDTTRFSGIVASNCLWNKQYDTFIDYKHQVKSGCIVCIVYFVTID